MIAYLAGGINGLNDFDARDWREYAKQKLNCDTLDPMRRDYRGKEDENVEEIVNGDLDDIDASDIILASCVRPSWGTAMELHYAATQATPICAVVTLGKPVSPWLRYFTTEIHENFDSAIDSINERNEKGTARTLMLNGDSYGSINGER